MKIYKVYRADGIFEVAIMKHKENNKYSLVNLTKGHICTCKFDTIDDAIRDLDECVRKEKVLKYMIDVY